MNMFESFEATGRMPEVGLHFLTGVLMGCVYYDMDRSYIETPSGRPEDFNAFKRRAKRL